MNLKYYVRYDCISSICSRSVLFHSLTHTFLAPCPHHPRRPRQHHRPRPIFLSPSYHLPTFHSPSYPLPTFHPPLNGHSTVTLVLSSCKVKPLVLLINLGHHLNKLPQILWHNEVTSVISRTRYLVLTYVLHQRP